MPTYKPKMYKKKPKITKSIFPIDLTAVNSSANYSYFVAKYPCTLGSPQLTFSSAVSFYYALLVVREGQATPVLNINDQTSPFIAPEHDVLLQGVWVPGTTLIQTKTKRNMQDGDELVLLIQTPGTSDVVNGTLQFFVTI